MMDLRPLEPPVEFDLASNGGMVRFGTVAEVRAWAERELRQWRAIEPHRTPESEFSAAVGQQLDPILNMLSAVVEAETKRGNDAAVGLAMLRRVAAESLAVYQSGRALWHGSAAAALITARLEQQPTRALERLAEAIGLLGPAERLASLRGRLTDLETELAQFDKETDDLAAAVRRRRSARAATPAPMDQPRPEAPTDTAADWPSQTADMGTVPAADAAAAEQPDSGLGPVESDAEFAASFATKLNRISVSMNGPVPTPPAQPLLLQAVVEPAAAKPAKPLRRKAAASKPIDGGAAAATPGPVPDVAEPAALALTEPATPAVANARRRGLWPAAAALLLAVALGVGGLFVGAKVGVIQRDTFVPVLVLSRDAVNDGKAAWDTLALGARTHVMQPLSDAMAQWGDALAQWVARELGAAQVAPGGVEGEAPARPVPGLDVRVAPNPIAAGDGEADRLTWSEAGGSEAGGSAASRAADAVGSGPKSGVAVSLPSSPEASSPAPPALPQGSSVAAAPQTHLPIPSIDTPPMHPVPIPGVVAGPPLPFLPDPPPIGLGHETVIAAAEQHGIVYDVELGRLRFVVRTRHSKGPNDVVSVADDMIQVTADGAAAVGADGRRQTWFDPTRRITTRIASSAHGPSEKTGYLPLRHSVIFDGLRYRFTFSAGERFFVRVVAEQCSGL